MLSSTLTRRVEWGDCDPAGIVFNPQFFRWFDHGTTMLYEAAGWPKQEMLKRFDAAGCPLVDTRASFKAPCRYGDDVEITTEIVEAPTFFYAEDYHSSIWPRTRAAIAAWAAPACPVRSGWASRRNDRSSPPHSGGEEGAHCAAMGR